MRFKKQILSILLLLTFLFTGCQSAVNPAEEGSDVYAIAEIQKYGNLLLSISGTEFMEDGYTCGDIITAEINGTAYDMPIGSNYADVDEGNAVCRIAINPAEEKDCVILAINMGDLATDSGLAIKTETKEEPGYRWDVTEGASLEISISMKEQGGYYDEYILRQLQRTNERTDYPHLTDAEFANFRPITTTGMGEGKLYRSSSPINPKLGRNTYADAALQEAGIRTILNLADAEETMQSYESWSESNYSSRAIIPLNMSLDFQAEDFQEKLAEGLRFLAANEGPYLLHCTEGKDRAGFTSAVLECLMGASPEEVSADYMVSYFNYYGVTPGSEQYTTIAKSNIEKSLATAFEIESIYADDVDLAAEASAYLHEKLGLTADEIAAVKANLS